ncbi:DUF4974 domain-containing protein [Sphingobacterium lumbrici]|uniref:DUF4974 domain-containing protein n=1 Tax=Sphingobacterium lumbrici TaxID=2559600 RepID=UPI00112B9123|nr:DUF4974 domain-containing protein [Sphingobacterium lumbrici]
MMNHRLHILIEKYISNICSKDEAVHFTGAFPRAYTLADIVKILKATNELKFKVEGREVTIIR